MLSVAVPNTAGRGVRPVALIGASSAAICRHNIDEYAFIGAGAVMTSDFPPYALMIGALARHAAADGPGQVNCPSGAACFELKEQRCTRKN